MNWLRWLIRKSRIMYPALLTITVFMVGFIAGNVSMLSTTNAQGRVALSDTDEAFEPFWDAFSIVESRYVDPVDVEILVDGAIDGMVAALDDEHSGYIRPELYETTTDFSGEFSGIGVTIRTIETTSEIEVVTVIPNSPAEGVGVEPGDIFFEVDGDSVVGMTQAELVTIVPGPRGTTVNITFKRDDDLVNYDIVRDVFEIPNVSYETVGDNIAHITMLDFNGVSRTQLDDALEAMDIENTNGLIFDMRGNPGGTLTSAIEIGSAFIEDGVLLRQVSRDQSEEITRTNGDYANIDVPIVVLVDETSASASEVIAGAMQDYGVATIVGETTFGKGTVQNIPQLSNGGGLRITIKRWLTPNGAWIHEQGITPDIIVEWNPETVEDLENDIQLQEAINYLESLSNE
jgi:carboxyl-terminal processing protease